MSEFRIIRCKKCLMWDIELRAGKVCQHCLHDDIVIIPNYIPNKQKEKWFNVFVNEERKHPQKCKILKT